MRKRWFSSWSDASSTTTFFNYHENILTLHVCCNTFTTKVCCQAPVIVRSIETVGEEMCRGSKRTPLQRIFIHCNISIWRHFVFCTVAIRLHQQSLLINSIFDRTRCNQRKSDQQRTFDHSSSESVSYSFILPALFCVGLLGVASIIVLALIPIYMQNNAQSYTRSWSNRRTIEHLIRLCLAFSKFSMTYNVTGGTFPEGSLTSGRSSALQNQVRDTSEFSMSIAAVFSWSVRLVHQPPSTSLQQRSWTSHSRAGEPPCKRTVRLIFPAA